MEIGWRLGIPFEGVGFPGHFLVRLTGEPGDLILDPFEHGASIHEEDCRRILAEVTGGALEFHEDLLASVSKHDMIRRLLHNLKGAYLRAGDDERALAAVERLLVLVPGDLNELRDAGLLLFRLRLEPSELEKRSGRDILVYAVDRGWVGENGVLQTQLGRVRAEGGVATAHAVINGKDAGPTFRFVRESDGWRFDLPAGRSGPCGTPGTIAPRLVIAAYSCR